MYSRQTRLQPLVAGSGLDTILEVNVACYDEIQIVIHRFPREEVPVLNWSILNVACVLLTALAIPWFVGITLSKSRGFPVILKHSMLCLFGIGWSLGTLYDIENSKPTWPVSETERDLQTYAEERANYDSKATVCRAVLVWTLIFTSAGYFSNIQVVESTETRFRTKLHAIGRSSGLARTSHIAGISKLVVRESKLGDNALVWFGFGTVASLVCVLWVRNSMGLDI